ncbi:hypothetical protein KQI42_11840 [Tissierella sp. MSJ-40]|uniref:Transcriptional regulator n=1 Tax=Tissierella simiarum TaxID=2841534 RepID=A0ABS6E714_9FIRM|nr:hypothetical protein [Tissierella simiarum]MBU5438708.1 hypothetical protein [Tissierella simiarum]
MKIAVVGYGDSVDKTLYVADKYYNNIDFVCFTVGEIDSCEDILEKCEKEVDGIIFTGQGFNVEVKKYGKLTKPFLCIPREGSCLMKTLWNIKDHYRDVKKVSIDILEEPLVHDIFQEFRIEFEEIFVFPFDEDEKESKYKEWHEKLLEQDKIDLAMTSFGSIYGDFKQRGLPVARIEITTPVIKNSIDILIQLIETKKLGAAQIGIQIIELNLSNEKANHYVSLKKKNLVESKLIEYLPLVQGSLVRGVGSEYIIFSTRGALENEKAQNYFLELMKDLSKEKLIIYSGTGYGTTAFHGDNNARTALQKAKEHKESSYYIVYEDESIKGPIGEIEGYSYNLMIKDKNLNKIAEEVGISPTYLSKIIAHMEISQKEIFEAKSLSEFLGVSERSARRILKKFLDSGYGEKVTSVQYNNVGRPTQFIKIKLQKSN